VYVKLRKLLNKKKKVEKETRTSQLYEQIKDPPVPIFGDFFYLSGMLGLVCHNPETGHKDDCDDPEKQPEPVNRIPVCHRQKLNRFPCYYLRRENTDKNYSYYSERQEHFLPYIHQVNLL